MPGMKVPGIQPQDPLPPARLFRPATHSPASSRQLDFDELRGLTRSNVQLVPPILQVEGLTTDERATIRKAVSLLCNLMEPRLLRKSEPGGEKPFDLVEMRLRSLSRLKRKWNKQDVSDELDTEEKQTFAESLRDGYVLCQLLNTLQSSPVVRPDVRGQDYNSTININKFLTACVAHGLPQGDLFLPSDLIEASGYSLARVASTVIALVQRFESSPPPALSPIPVASAVPAIHRAAKDLEEWVEHFVALTRQNMMSDQLPADSPPVKVDSECEFVRLHVFEDYFHPDDRCGSWIARYGRVV
ncbi:hypothetical protein FB45DRAFT_99053 [Roridomyces roridus]|uniref:Calponin-homology (CH) domain-containing protein n=1 Tax=Roridomyces roridus TaxID=1738132 RepID=A0AAD7FGN2_9AGAR|nr:hypothetical protein FB45DRAFT_99053 [Roridomyces roridus]